MNNLQKYLNIVYLRSKMLYYSNFSNPVEYIRVSPAFHVLKEVIERIVPGITLSLLSLRFPELQYVT